MNGDPAARVVATELVCSCPGDAEFALRDGALGYVRLLFSDGSRGELRLVESPREFDCPSLLGRSRAGLQLPAPRPLQLVP